MTSTDIKNAGKPWTKQEDELLIQNYNINNFDILTISNIHQRAPGGIVSRLVKNKIVSDKKILRGYDAYLKLEQTKPTEKISKNSKSYIKKEDDNDEIIMVDDTEYILNNRTVYDIKKIRGSIYGSFDDKTNTVRPLKSYIKRIINYLSLHSEVGINILWAGSDLELIKQYFPTLSITHITNLKSDSTLEFNICICNNYISQLDIPDDNLLEIINEKINYFCSLISVNSDLLLFESKNLHAEILAILIQNNLKIMEESNISSKTCFLLGIKKPEKSNMCIMVLDTETTGFPSSRNPKEIDKFNNARLIELGYIIYDETGKKIKEYDSLVKPNNFTITNTYIHGISQSEAIAKGKSIIEVLNELSSDLDNVQCFVCHNINFDMDIILAESYRSSMFNLFSKIESKKRICTMELGKKFMKLNKRPKLVELYKFLFKKEFIQDHRALSDCVACADCYYGMTF